MAPEPAPGRNDPARVPFRPDRPAVAELAAGAVVVRSSAREVLVLHHGPQRRWCFPKGHVEPGESIAQAALREVEEETGLSTVTLGPELATVHYRFYDPARDRSVAKTSIYFLIESTDGAIRPEPLFDSFAWVPIEEARRRVAFKEERSVLDAVVRAWTESSRPP